MRPRTIAIVVVACFAVPRSFADDVLYRYEGSVRPYDESAGWLVADPCEDPCSESVENGHFVLRWAQPADQVNYDLTVEGPGQGPPSTLWVEWRYRSNRSLGPNFFTCDGAFVVGYLGVLEVVFVYGDAAISFSGDDVAFGLQVDQFHTFRFDSLDGVNYRVSVDGRVFIDSFVHSTSEFSFLQLQGGGGCDRPELATVNEWDFVRYGTISFGEKIVASDPPEGFLDARTHAALDRFTVTFDSPNYVYIDEVSVEVTGGVAPVMTQTRRRENDEPDTVEIVLDRPIPIGATTRFTFDDGVAVNVVEYAFAPGDTDGDGDADLLDVAAFLTCFGLTQPTGPCWALDLNQDETIDLTDFAAFRQTITGP